MTELVFLRRKGLGLGTCKGISAASDGRISFVRNDKAHTFDWTGVKYLFRWGCTSHSPSGFTGEVINNSQAIHRVNNKASFAQVLGEHNLGPTCWLHPAHVEGYPVVVRPPTHSQGRNLWVCHSLEELLSVWREGYYIRPLINKVAEFRVYVLNGKVVTVAKKTPADPSAVAWNVAQGGRFDVVRWGDWPLAACDVAVKALHLSGLHYSGVDVMMDGEGNAYVIELNSAPSLPALADGQLSYRQTVHTKAILYVLAGLDGFALPFGAPPVSSPLSYRDYIHPGVLA
jgi:glutathione synthase/RimK-type ligase-like ATP-grasp enzyme